MRPGAVGQQRAHVPALRALPDFEVVAVATTRRETALAAARDIGLAEDRAFDDASALARDPAVDLVAVTVKVPHHRSLVEAAAAAGKHVYCEWPLGDGLADAEAITSCVRAAGVRATLGLQARMAPAIRHAACLVAEGYVGQVLSVTLVGSGMQWGATVDRSNAYIIDRAHGATILSIPVGHTLDAVCHMLGEFRSVMATTAVRQPDVIRTDNGERLAKTAADQIVFHGVLESGAIASVHYRGGMSRGTKLLWEINGRDGDLQLTAEGGHAQIFDIKLFGGRGGGRALAPIAIDPQHRFVPEELSGPAVNVAQLYACFANDIREGTSTSPTLDEAIARHRLIDAIERSAAEGRRVDLA